MPIPRFAFSRLVSVLLPLALSSVSLAGPDSTKNDAPRAASKGRFLAVLPLGHQGVDASAANVLTEALADEILRLKRVRVMERSQMENILKEQGFQQSGACDGSECAVEVGRILGIDLMVVGTLGKIGNTYTLSVRAVDVGSSEVVASARRSIRGEIDILFTEMLPVLAKELVSGVVTGSASSPDRGASTKVLDTFVDPRDDQRYEYARIGSLDWMMRNMNYRVSQFSSWCYDDAPGNCGFLGRLYVWDKATLACPQGWRLPTDQEWKDLAENLGGMDKAGDLMRSAKGAKDNSLFRAKAAGFRDPEGHYLGIGAFSLWWSATESDTATAGSWGLDFSGTSLGFGEALKANGYSVRCVRPVQ